MPDQVNDNDFQSPGHVGETQEEVKMGDQEDNTPDAPQASQAGEIAPPSGFKETMIRFKSEVQNAHRGLLSHDIGVDERDFFDSFSRIADTLAEADDLSIVEEMKKVPSAFRSRFRDDPKSLGGSSSIQLQSLKDFISLYREFENSNVSSRASV